MQKGKATVKKMQLRRCGFCQKTGHNKSTCLAAKQAAKQTYDEPPQIKTPSTEQRPLAPQTVRQPLNFFVHHVQYQNHESAHVVNLREHKQQLHENIESAGPKQERDFYYFHQKPEKNSTLNLSYQTLAPEITIPAETAPSITKPIPLVSKPITAPSFSPYIPTTSTTDQNNTVLTNKKPRRLYSKFQINFPGSSLFKKKKANGSLHMLKK